VLYTGNLHHNLVQVPFISHTRQPATDLVGECLAELEAPLPYGFMADDDAAGGEDLIDVAQAEWKAEIEPDGMADDLGRKAIAGVAGRGGRYHPVRLRDLAYLDKPDRTQVDGAGERHPIFSICKAISSPQSHRPRFGDQSGLP